MSEELIQAVDLGSILGPPGPEGPQGLSLEYKWCGTKLGIRVQGQTEFSYVDLLGTPGEPGVQGEQGKQGIQGKSLEYKWCGTKLGIRLEGECKYLYVDLQGQQGNPGLIGPPGKDGKQGIPGIQGKSLEYKWNGTQLGIRVQGQTEYMYIDLQGPPGPPGPPGTLNWCDIVGKPDIPETIPPTEHDHNHLYYTKIQVNELLNKKLDIVGGAITGNLAVHGVLVGNNNITAYSDKKLKSNIKKIKSPLEKLKLLNGYSYTKNNKKEIGVLAQEVEKIFPMLVHKDDKGIKMVDYGLLVAFLIECVKSQQDQINYLKQKVR